MYFPFKNVFGRDGIKPTRKQEACYHSESNEQVRATGIGNSGSCSMVHVSGPGPQLVLQGWFGGHPPHPDHAGRELPQRAPPLWCPLCSTSRSCGQLGRDRARPSCCWQGQALGRDPGQGCDPTVGCTAMSGSLCSSTGVFGAMMAVLPSLFSIPPAPP